MNFVENGDFENLAIGEDFENLGSGADFVAAFGEIEDYLGEGCVELGEIHHHR